MNSRARSLITCLMVVVTAVLTLTVWAVEQSVVSFTGVVEQRTPIETTELSPVERAQALQWQLSEVEWRRYQALRQGIRGSVSPSTLSPIEVLGIHARDDAERRRYAEHWAQMMREDAQRILAFQAAYDAAVRRLYGVEPLIDISRLPQAPPVEPPLLETDRIVLFTRVDCVRCEALLERVLSRLDTVDGLDVYLLDVAPGDASTVRTWASSRNIVPADVRSRRVTLNFDAGAFAALTHGRADVPYLMRRRGETLTPLPAAAL